MSEGGWSTVIVTRRVTLCHSYHVYAGTKPSPGLDHPSTSIAKVIGRKHA